MSYPRPPEADERLGTRQTFGSCIKPSAGILSRAQVEVNTLRALEEGIEDYSGCAVIISHDRWFLDRICTHILAFEGDSNVYWFEGNFQDYEENRKKRLGGDIVPHRMKYRKLVRG